MGFEYKVYKAQRVCPIRFQRLVVGKPWITAPDIDDRGYFRPNSNLLAESDRGPVVGITEGDGISVGMLREKIDANAPLFVTSSDETVMTCAESKRELPRISRMSLQLKAENTAGASGVLPKGAKLRIHYGSPTGVVIGELSVWVFEKLTVNLTPFRVTVFDVNVVQDTPRTDINAVIEAAKAYWQPCGIAFRVNPILPHIINLQNLPGQVLAENMSELFERGDADTINVYFVNQTDDGTWGYGRSRAFVTEFRPGTKPGILIAEKMNGSSGMDDRSAEIQTMAHVLAHEIGHFLGLAHVDNRSPDDDHPDDYRDDTWSRRNMMHNYTPSAFTDKPPPGSPIDVGYGVDPVKAERGRTGALITLKKLIDSNNNANHISDPQYLTARETIKSAAGPY